jgi:cbb3-type cytochrome c oxidase subunit III
MKTWFVLVALLGAIAPSAVHSENHDSAKGEQLFQQLCIGCHGPDGRAQTDMGKRVQAADLTSAVVHDQSDSQLVHVIRNGRGKMPAWSDKLSDSDIHALLSYIRQFRSKED